MASEIEILTIPLFAGWAYHTKSLDFSGSVAAFLMALSILYLESFGWFLLMLLFFVAGTFSTKFCSEKKRSMDLCHEVRGYKNVIANGLVPVIGAYLHSFPLFLGAIAAVTADTLSCEIGELSKSRPRLITTLKPVKAGTNGAVSLLGEGAAIFAGLAVGGFAIFFGFVGGVNLLLASLAAAFVGANFDSFLGATLENAGLLSKHQVNLLCALSGAFVAAFLL